MTFTGVSFSLGAGEVLALAGIDGNGQRELADTLAGVTRPEAGSIMLDGRDITRAGVRAKLAAGIAYIPADRAGTSLVQSMSIEDNLMLRDFERQPFSSGGRIDATALRAIAIERIAQFNVRSASPAAPARTLSGGNQQKVALARELSRQPEILIAFQPTWGLDPGATRFVIESILAMRDRGGAVLYISSELEEVLAVGALHGSLGEEGAGFPQSPLFANAAWLPKLIGGTDLHSGIVFAVLAALIANFLLLRTTPGFRWRLVGASLPAARYACVSPGKTIFGLMAIAGSLAGLAGAIECLGVHYRLIEGFSAGFGFNAVAIALMGALNPLYVLPSALFFGFLETGALAMQRQVGVPSSLVLVIQGLTMVFVLCAIGRSGGERV